MGGKSKQSGRVSGAIETTAPSSAATDNAYTGGDKRKGLTTMGKIGVYLLFPTTVGALGLFVSYLEIRRQQRSTEQKEEEKEMDFDRDFVVPFLLALAMVVVISIQSNGFSGKVEPLVQWPKVRRVKKVVHRTVGQDSTSKKDE